MITIELLTADDAGRDVVYDTGHTRLTGALVSWDEDFCYVKFIGGTHKMQFLDKPSGLMKPGTHKVSMDCEIAVKTDPANLEFA